MTPISFGESFLKKTEVRILAVVNAVVFVTAYLVLGGSNSLGLGAAVEVLSLLIGLPVALFLVLYSFSLIRAVSRRANEAHRSFSSDKLVLWLSMFMGALPFALGLTLLCVKHFFEIPL